MAKHPHCEVIMEWAQDTSKVVQFYSGGKWRDVIGKPTWGEQEQYRIKPEPKPNVMREYFCNVYKQRCPEHYEKPHLRLTFDGETGKLIKAEVL